MIDADQLERDVDAADGDAIALRKETIREVIVEMRRGQAAIRAIASACSAATTAIVTSGLRVSDGYNPPSRLIEP